MSKSADDATASRCAVLPFARVPLFVDAIVVVVVFPFPFLALCCCRNGGLMIPGWMNRGSSLGREEGAELEEGRGGAGEEVPPAAAMVESEETTRAPSKPMVRGCEE